MIFADSTHNLKLELIDYANCKLEMIKSNPKELDGINRILAARIRQAPLEGGDRLNFTHKLSSDKSYILIQGDLIEAVVTLEGIERLTNELKDDIIERIVLNMLQQALDSMSPERRLAFADKLRASLPASSSSDSHSPTLFTPK